jgi:hypothetical protein
MAMVKDLFVDGIGNIAVQAGLVRMELTQIQALPAEGASPVLEITERLAMSLETMLKLHGALSEIVNQMEHKGLIRKKSDEIVHSTTAAEKKVKT